MIVIQLIQNIMLLLVTGILITNNVTCSTVERGTTEHDPRSGEDAVSNVKDDITSSSNNALTSRNYTVDQQEILFFGFINRIQELVGNGYQLKDEKDAIIHENEAKIQVLQNNINSLQEIHQFEKEKLKGEIETKDSLIEEHIGKERKCKEENDSIVHQKEAQIQALENNFKSLQDRLEMQKVQHNREIQTKDSLIQEQARRQKEQTESLEKENRDLQEQIKTLKIQVTDKEAELQPYLPQNKEGTWIKYSVGDEDGVVSDDCERYKVYVCRAEVDGDVVPGWKWPSDEVCIVYHNGEEYYKSQCEVLVPNSSFEWISCHGDEIPPVAVPGGKRKGGEVLYVGRVKDTYGSYYVGKVQPSLNGCYNRALVNGDFTVYSNYEILVWK